MSGDGAGEIVDERSEQEIAERFHELESAVVEVATKTRTMFVYIAKCLVEIQDERLWALEYTSWNEFLASPGLGIAPPSAKAMCGVYRALVVERKVPVKELEGVDLRKLQTALPAIKAGEVRPLDGIADAKALSRSDMERTYRRGREKPLDAGDEPELRPCELCGTWLPVGKLDGAA